MVSGCVYLVRSDWCVTNRSPVIVIIKLNQQQTQQLLEVVRRLSTLSTLIVLRRVRPALALSLG